MGALKTWVKAVAESVGVGETSLADIERGLPPLPDPAGTFWVTDRFVSSPLVDLEIGPDSLAGVRDAPDIEAMLPPVMPDVAIGMRVEDPSSPRKVYPDGKTARMERLGISLYARPDDVHGNWREPIVSVGKVEGMRWVIRGSRASGLVCDAATVVGLTPGWRMFGPSGERVVRILAQIDRLTAAQVRSFSRSGWDPSESPTAHPALERALGAARGTVVGLMESRAQVVDEEAGGEYYRGCYFVYELNHPQWLAALDAGLRAVTAEVLSETLDPSVTETLRAPWRELLALS